MSTGLKANPDGSAAIQVGGTDVITLTSGGAATFVTSPTTVQAGTAAAPSITTSGDTNTGIFFPAADTIAFAEGGAEALRINSSGTVVLSGGDTSANGTGITFPATQSASSNANTLDDYEEGTWTPAVAFGGASVGITYVGRGGWYTKIGNTVNITGWFYLSNKGSSTGDVTITGLPFTEGGKYAVCNFGRFENFTFSVQLNSRIGVGLSQIDLFETSAAGALTSITNSDFTNGAITYFSATYFI
jgi:hypothetical protein